MYSVRESKFDVVVFMERDDIPILPSVASGDASSEIPFGKSIGLENIFDISFLVDGSGSRKSHLPTTHSMPRQIDLNTEFVDTQDVNLIYNAINVRRRINGLNPQSDKERGISLDSTESETSPNPVMKRTESFRLFLRQIVLRILLRSPDSFVPLNILEERFKQFTNLDEDLTDIHNIMK